MYKQIFIILVLVSILFSAAPDWVKTPLKVEYTGTPGGAIVFEVTTRTETDIGITLTVDGAPGGKPTDNATGVSGQFWYDNTKTAKANYDETFDGWKVVEKEVSITAGGKTWKTAELTKIVSGIDKTRYVDRETGLLIKEESSVQTVLLDSVTPSFDAATVEVTPPKTETVSSPLTPPTNESTSPSIAETTNQTTESDVPVDATLPQTEKTTQKTGIKPPDSNAPCCPLGLVLLVSVLVFYNGRSKN